MNADYFRRMFDYNLWANQRVWNCILQLSNDQFYHPSDYSVGSLHAQLVHTMGVERLFYLRSHGTSLDRLPNPEEYPTRDIIRVAWDEINWHWQTYIDQLNDTHLVEIVSYMSFNGGPRQQPRWELLTQMLNHSTDHRAQTLALIHSLGGTTIQQDFIFYTWERSGLEEA